MRVLHHRAARWIGCSRGHPGELQRDAVGQGHMAVVTAEESGTLVRYRIDQCLCRQLRRIPALIIPIAACNPFSWRHPPRLLADSPRELLRRGGVLQVYVVELASAI